MRLTDEQIEARWEALTEAAEHLRQDWTEDPEEQAQSEKARKQIETLRDRWYRNAKKAQQQRPIKGSKAVKRQTFV